MPTNPTSTVYIPTPVSELPDANNTEPWIKTSEQLPLIGSNIEYSDDGVKVDGTCNYKDDRRCMMAGIAGGFGYFGPGFATDGLNGEDTNLILDPPNFWRYI
jgi:hypothetical protein